MRVMTIEAPLGGINRRLGFQNQPEFTTYDSVNFWPLDPLTGRAVLCTRPVLAAYPTPAGTVNMLTRINADTVGKPLQGIVAAADGDIYWFDGLDWQAATGSEAGSAPTGTPLYAAGFLQEVFIPSALKPIVFNYVSGDAEYLVETAGTAPSNCLMFAVWKGAVWTVSGNENEILRGSRVGDGYDWDSSVSLEDEGGAFSTAGEQEGLLRGPITAIMPHTEDTMLVSTLEGLCALRGHPRQGGIIAEVSRNCTVLGPGAWTRTPDGTLFMMTRNGFMSLGTQQGAVPAPVSQGKVPAELTGLRYNYDNPTVSVIYDLAYDGIHIVDRFSGNPQAWFYHVPTGGFHRMEFDNYPIVMTEYEAITAPLSSGVLWGGEGSSNIDEYQGIGFFSSLDILSESFSAYAEIGPIQIGQDGRSRGKILSMRVNAEVEFSGSSTIKVAVDADAFGTVCRLDAGEHQWEKSLNTIALNNGICYPLQAGSAATFQIEHGPGGRIMFEQLVLDVEAAGANRTKPFRPPL